MRELTPQETLQAITDGKNLEYRLCGTDDWRYFNHFNNGITIEGILRGSCIFRLCREMITVGGVSFPKPETTKPASGIRYWSADPIHEDFTRCFITEWADNSYDNRVLSRGLLHLSEENAIAHAKALVKLSGGNTND